MNQTQGRASKSPGHKPKHKTGRNHTVNARETSSKPSPQEKPKPTARPANGAKSLWVRVTAHLEEARHRLLAQIRYLATPLRQERHALPEKLIVSLTSYPPRFPTLHLTIKTLLSQDTAPDLLILWLFESDLPHLPTNTLKLVGSRFEVRTVSRDIRSFKKLIPTLSAYPTAVIVTADDDTYYRRDWLRGLLSGYRPGSQEVLGYRAHRITSCQNNTLCPYSQWQTEIASGPAESRVFLTGMGGILYPPATFDSEVLNAEAFMNLCPTADDVWFYFMLRRNNRLCRKVGGVFDAYSWAGTEDSSLFRENYHEKRNDEAIRNLLLAYGNPLQ